MFKKLKLKNHNLLLLLSVGVLAGIILTVGTSTALNFTDTPEFCSTCHVMNIANESFSESTHAHLDCNDCHAPHDSFAKKIIFKTEAGFHDIYMNTFQSDKIPDVFHANEKTKDVVQQNCISCHQSTMRDVSHDAKESCTDCHRYVPHGKGRFEHADWFEPVNSK